jgi:hypothetical protein
MRWWPDHEAHLKEVGLFDLWAADFFRSLLNGSAYRQEHPASLFVDAGTQN